MPLTASITLHVLFFSRSTTQVSVTLFSTKGWTRTTINSFGDCRVIITLPMYVREVIESNYHSVINSHLFCHWTNNPFAHPMGFEPMIFSETVRQGRPTPLRTDNVDTFGLRTQDSWMQIRCDSHLHQRPIKQKRLLCGEPLNNLLS